MNPLDIVLLVGLSYGLIAGFRKGLIMELISLTAFILAIFGALKLMDFTLEFVSHYVTVDGVLIPVLVFVALFVLLILGINAAGKLLKKVIHLTPLGMFDSIIGGIIGVLKWGFAFSIVIWVIGLFDQNLINGYAADTVILPYVEPVAPWIFSYTETFLPFLTDLISNIH